VAGWLATAYFLRLGAPPRLRQVVKGCLILIFVNILIVGGYSYFNYLNFGYFGITYKLGISLTQKTAPVIERLPDNYAAIREVLIKARNRTLVASGGTNLTYIEAIRPQLVQLTGLSEPRLANYLLKLNLLLIRKAPLNYLQEVVAAFGRYWFPTSTDLANFHSRHLQTLWAVVHILVMTVFAVNLLLIIGATTLIKGSDPVVEREYKVTIGTDTIDLQQFAYGLAGMIVAYTAAISCFIDVGDPRHRVPTDVIIVFMLFLGVHLWRCRVEFVRTLFKRGTAAYPVPGITD
jgi:hypothetical protein